MYTLHQLETPSTKTVVEKICPPNRLEPEGNLMHTQDHQKKNMFQNMYSAWNVIWRNFSKVPSTFLRNRNNPLSVTLVQNEGIISPEFFKHLTRREEPLTTDNIHIDKLSMKKALDIEEKFESSTFHGSHMDYAMERFNIFKRIKDPECMDRFEELVKFGKLDRFDTVDMSDYIVDRHDVKLTKTTELDVLAVYYYPDDQTDHSSNKTDSTKYTEKSADIKQTMIPEEKKPAGNIGKLNIDKEPSTMRPVAKSEKAKESSVCRTGTLVSTFLRRQKALANSKQTAGRSFSERKKLDAAVNVRGQDRVEQTKDRMERGKQNNPDDAEEHRCCVWQIDANDFSDNDEEFLMDTELFSNDKAIKPTTCTSYVTPVNVANPLCQRPETKSVVDRAETSKCLTRARFVPGPFSDLHTIRNGYSDRKCYPEIDSFRSRLSSESSVDSEDSYCIVFETDLEESSKVSPSIEDDVEIEEDEEEEEEDDDEDDDDEDEDEDENEEVDEPQSDIELSASKVRFNLMPKVHVMVQWDYAYRAARRGPWEEMARDRVRFKGRINSIDRVLSPILSAQHRTRIWQERFAT